jgi:hypothetical protein
MEDIKDNQDTTGDADGEPSNIDKSIPFLFPDVADGNLHITFKHGSPLLQRMDRACSFSMSFSNFWLERLIIKAWILVSSSRTLVPFSVS